jgi:ATP-binding protein involved in chromosome partitioning
MMFGVKDQRPSARTEDGVDWIIPIEKHGVKLLSVGFFVKPEDAVIWRGPMATSALKQLITQGDWGELDYLLIDLPPGTGDVHLTMVQEVPVTGVVIVSTPQEVALADVIKGINMFTGDKINVPVLGLVENMSWFTPEELPDNKYYLFGKDGCKKLAEKLDIELLGQIPIVQGIRESGDSGKPVALKTENASGQAFSQLAKAVEKAVIARNKELDPTTKVEITTK